ncbi:MAG: hypothetical protein U0N82_04280 [Oscillospiraceae bacterium]
MKRIINLLVVIAVIGSLSVTALAANNKINYNSSQTTQSSGLNVSYNVAPNFTVTIPASVSLGEEVTVATDQVVVAYGKAVNVKLSGTSENDNSFKLRTAEGAELVYTVKKGSGVVCVGDTILSVEPESEEIAAVLSFVAPSSITYAGNYTGTVTFSIVVE